MAYFAVLALSLVLELALGLLNAPGPWHILPQLILIIGVCVEDGVRERTSITPLTVVAAAYSIVVLLPIACNDLESNPVSLDASVLARGAAYHLLFFASLVCTYMGLRPKVYRSASTTLGLTSKQLSSVLVWTGSLSAATWVLHLSLMIVLARINLLAYAQDPLALFAEARYGTFNWAMYLKEAFYGMFCAAFALAMHKKQSRLMYAICGLFIAAYSATSGYKHSWFTPILAVLIVQGYVRRRPTGPYLIAAMTVLLLGIPLGFVWRDGVTTQTLGRSLLGYNEVFYFASRAISEIEPNPQYFTKALWDLLLTPVPRAIWSGKPELYGLTNEVLTYHMYNTSFLPTVRSFPTMGLAEAWISMGSAGIAVSGALVGGLLAACARALRRGTTPGRLMCAVVITMDAYMILRVSIFDTLVYKFIAIYVISFVLIDPIVGRKRQSRWGIRFRRKADAPVPIGVPTQW